MIRWLRRLLKSPVAGPFPVRHGFVDVYRRVRDPSAWELLAELKSTAYTCASINAAVCASFRPKLYVSTAPGQPEPKCPTRRIPLAKAMALDRGDDVRRVADHPIVRLLDTANPVHNGHDLLEQVTLQQEISGICYLLVTPSDFGSPGELWPLPSHLVHPRRDEGSPRLVDWYDYHGTAPPKRFRPEDLIVFQYPDPTDPYRSGLSPLRAAYEQAVQSSEFTAFKTSLWKNSGMPGAIVSPKEVISREEADRLEVEWENRFSRGGQGKFMASTEPLDVRTIEQRLGDLAMIAEAGFSKEQIANAFGVPLAFLTKETNLANLQASQRQHAALAIRPRLARRDQKLNEKLVPLFDDSGRLFLRSDDPVSEDQENLRAWQELDLKLGTRTINEVRAERGLSPVEWGDKPWLPLQWAPHDFDRRQFTVFAPAVGRNREGRADERSGDAGE